MHLGIGQKTVLEDAERYLHSYEIVFGSKKVSDGYKILVWEAEAFPNEVHSDYICIVTIWHRSAT